MMLYRPAVYHRRISSTLLAGILAITSPALTPNTCLENLPACSDNITETPHLAFLDTNIPRVRDASSLQLQHTTQNQSRFSA